MLRLRALRELLWLAAYALLALVITAQFAREPDGLRSNPRSRFRPMIEGTAHRPYVQRVVVPTMVRAAGALVGHEARARLDAALDESHPATRVLDHVFPGWERDLAVEYLAAFALMWAWFLGFAYAFRALLTAVYRAPWYVEGLAPAAAYLVLVPTFAPYASYLYDPALLCLYTAALALLARRQFGAYLAVLAVACSNKETAVLLPLVFYLAYRGDPGLSTRRFFALLVAQVALVALIAGGLAWSYSDNPGGPLEVRGLRNVYELPRWSLGTIAAAVIAFVLVARGWSAKPAFLRAALVPLVPLVTLAACFGYVDELRDYYEVYPVLLLLAAPTLLAAVGVELGLRHDARRSRRSAR